MRGHGNGFLIGLTVAVLAVVAFLFIKTGRPEQPAPGEDLLFDQLDLVVMALVEEYEMELLPEGAGSATGHGWVERGFLSSQNPAPTVEQVKATIESGCSDCTVSPYMGDSYLLRSPDTDDPERFVVLSWEGPLGNDDDGGFALVSRKPSDPTAE